MKHSAPRGRQLKRLACLSTVTVVLAMIAAPSSGVAQGPVVDPATPPAVDEIASSRNITQIANLPK